jgi:prophage tail gpP-like protein
MPTHDVRLKIGNIAYGGWQQIEVTRTIEAISGSFKLGVSEKWPGQQSRFAIKRGSACSVTIDGKSIITGYIDEVEPTYDKGEHSVSFSGRDKTGDLVDSSAIATPGTWIGTGLMPIVQQLVAKFGIPVVANVDLGRVFDGFSLQQGESVFEAIERLCARRGVLPVSDGQGGLILTRAGSGGANTTLKLGVNVLKARGTYDDKQRFSKYIMLGQSAGSDYVDPSVTVGPHAEATDPGISRYRPLIVFVPLTDVANSLQDRANWEASVRAGRAT